jgi:hypothetical protein
MKVKQLWWALQGLNPEYEVVVVIRTNGKTQKRVRPVVETYESIEGFELLITETIDGEIKK